MIELPQTKPLLDVETQLYLAQQSGQMSGPGYDIEQLKRSGLVVPDSSSPIGVRQVAWTGDGSNWNRSLYAAGQPKRAIMDIEGAGWNQGVYVAGKPKQAISTEQAKIYVPGQPKIPIPEKTVTIPITQAELQTIADAQAKGLCVGTMKAYYTVKMFKVTLRDGSTITVEALSEDDAKRKAEEAGYKSAWITQQFTAQGITTKEETISVKDPSTGQTMVVPKNEWDNLPDKYKNIVKTQGFEAMGQAFNADYTQMGDGQYISNTDLSDLASYDQQNGTNYVSIATTQGFDALQSQMQSDTDARDAAVAKLDKYKTKDGYNLLEARADGVTPGEMRLAGFDDDAVSWVDSAYKESRASGVALPGEVGWVTKLDPKTGKQIEVTGQEAKDVLATAERIMRQAAVSGTYTPASTELDQLVLSGYQINGLPVIKRGIIEGVSSLFFAPTRMALPEVHMSDITPLEWAIGGAQLAALALPIVPAAIQPVVSAAAGGIFGYATAQSWDQLSVGGKILGVGMTALVAAPAIISIARFAESGTSALARATVKSNVVRTINGKLSPVKKVASVWDTATSSLQQIINKVKGTPAEVQVRPAINEVTDALLSGDPFRLKAAGAKLEAAASSAKRGTAIDQMVRDGGSYVRTNAPDLIRSAEYRVIVQDIIDSTTWQEARVKLEDFWNILDATQSEALVKPRAPSETLSAYLSKEIYRSQGASEIEGQVGPRPVEEYWMRNPVQEALAQATQDKLQKLIEAIPWKDRLYRDLASRSVETRKLALQDMWDYLIDRYGEPYLKEYLKVETLNIGEMPNVKLSGLEEAVNVSDDMALKGQIDDVMNEVQQILKENKNRPPDAPPPKSVEKINPPGEGRTGTKVAVKEKVAVRTTELTAEEKAALRKAQTQRALENMTEAEKKALVRAREKVRLAQEQEQRALEAVQKVEAERLVRAAPVTQTQPFVTPQYATGLPKGVKPEVVAGTKVSTITRTETQPATEVSPLVAPMTEVQPVTRVQTKVMPQTRTQTRAQTAVQPETMPKVMPEVATSQRIGVRVGLQTVPRRRLPTVEYEGQTYAKVPKGSIAWRQGVVWKYIPPPWTQEKPISLKQAPLGAKTGGRTPKETIQMIGQPGSPVPRTVSVDLGIADILIEDYGKRITFTGHGLETSVGHSMAGPTRGMSLTGVTPTRTFKKKRKKRDIIETLSF
jgi:hypothetical protein